MPREEPPPRLRSRSKKRIKTDPITDPTRIAWLEERSASLPRHLKPLEQRLVALGGSYALVKPDENYFAQLMARGRLIPGRGARLIKGEQSACHTNSARLFAQAADKREIATGYALSKNGLWVQHTWIIEKGTVIETTVRRLLYFGCVLEWLEAARFATANLPPGELMELAASQPAFLELFERAYSHYASLGAIDQESSRKESRDVQSM